MASISMTIKADLKKLGANVVSVRTNGAYSLTAVIRNTSPDVAKKCREYLDGYQMGDYNMIEDIYEYRKGRPATAIYRFVTLGNGFSDELLEQAWARMKITYSDYSGFTGNLKDNSEEIGVNTWVGTEVRKFLCGDDFFSGESAKFWNEIETNKS